jgi:hypothetical protein
VGELSLACSLARLPRTLLGAAQKVVGGRTKSGHDTGAKACDTGAKACDTGAKACDTGAKAFTRLPWGLVHVYGEFGAIRTGWIDP